MHIQTKRGTMLTLVAIGAILALGALRACLREEQLAPGDRVVSYGTPDPQRALVYTAGRLPDASIGRRHR